jgi:hypothetical protein
MFKRFGPLAMVLAIALLAPACSSSKQSGPAVGSYPAGTTIDSGFRPTQNGLPFENYGGLLSDGGEPSNMTAADVQKMFGDAVSVDPITRPSTSSVPATTWPSRTSW